MRFGIGGVLTKRGKKLVKRNQLYKEIKKYLFITDTRVIDVIFAVYLSVKNDNERLWFFIVGDSGAGKTELIRPLMTMSDVIPTGRITRAGIMSGHNTSTDLLSEINNAGGPQLILILDMAQISSLPHDKKTGIFADFRLWFDGLALNRTSYQNTREEIKIGFIACITPQIRDDPAIFSANNIGTREFFFGLGNEDFSKTCVKIKENNGRKEAMRDHLKNAYNEFLKDKEFKHYKLDPTVDQYLMKKAQEIAINRASGQLDKMGHYYLTISKENPTRCYDGLLTLYHALMSLDKGRYPEARFKAIIENVVKHAGCIQRYDILQYLKWYPNDKFRSTEIQERLRINRHLVNRELDGLFQLGVLNREIVEEKIGGFYKNVYYYWLNRPTNKTLFP
jgi:predicted transcriptional regulator